MSQENVALVRRVYAALGRGDIDAGLAEGDDDFEVDWSNSRGPAKGVYRGKDSVRRFLVDLLWEAFRDVQVEEVEIIDVDESRVIAVNHVRMQGRTSGVEVDAEGATVWTIQAGKPRHAKLFQSRREALESLGPARP